MSRALGLIGFNTSQIRGMFHEQGENKTLQMSLSLLQDTRHSQALNSLAAQFLSAGFRVWAANASTSSVPGSYFWTSTTTRPFWSVYTMKRVLGLPDGFVHRYHPAMPRDLCRALRLVGTWKLYTVSVLSGSIWTPLPISSVHAQSNVR